MNNDNLNNTENVFGFNSEEVEVENDFGFKDEENSNSNSKNNINTRHDLLNNKMISVNQFNQFNLFKKKYNNKNIDTLFDDFDNKRIDFNNFLDNVLDILNSKNDSEPNSNSISYSNNLKKYMKKKSIKYPKFTYCDILVKNLTFIKQRNKDNDVDIINTLMKYHTLIIKHLYNTPESIIDLIKNLKYQIINHYSNIVENSSSINIYNIYSNSSLELTIAYLLIFNHNITLKEENYIDNNNLIKNEHILELCDYTFGFLYHLDYYIKKQLTYFVILKEQSSLYGTYYLKLVNYNMKINIIKKNLYNWFTNIKLNITPNDNDIDNWRIYYNYKYLMYSVKNEFISRFQSNKKCNEENDNFNIIPIKLCKSKETAVAFIDCLYELSKKNLNNMISNELINTFIENTFLILDDDENFIDYNIEKLSKVNKFILDNGNITVNQEYKNIWKQKYHDLCNKILYDLLNTLEEVIEFVHIFDSKNKNADENNIRYGDYNLFAIGINYINNTLHEIFRIIKIYYQLSFDNNLISDLFVLIFRLYNNNNIKEFFKNNRDKYLEINSDREKIKEKNKEANKNTDLGHKLSSNHYKLFEIYNNMSKSLTDVFKYSYVEYIKSFKQSNTLTSIIEKLINNQLNYFEIDLESVYTIKINNVIRNNFLILYEKCSTEVLITNNISEEFLDPITFEVIKEPMILPDTNQITDKKVIYQILLTNPRNPFSGLPLTYEELEKYNQSEDIINKINDFKTRLNMVLSLSQN